MRQQGKNLTAFVLAGGGSLGAVQVGMLAHSLGGGLVPDLIVGASVGAINAAYYAAEPDERGVERLKRIWLELRRTDVFPFSPIASMLGFFGKTDHLVSPRPLRSLIESELPYQRLEDARIPCYVVATDALEGTEVVLSSGPAATALLASAAIPAVFPPVTLDGRFLLDGGVSNNTPISIAVEMGATRVIVLPTGISLLAAGALLAPWHWPWYALESSHHAPARQRYRTLRQRGRCDHRATALPAVDDQLRLLAICRVDSARRGRDQALASNGWPATPRRATRAVAASSQRLAR